MSLRFDKKEATIDAVEKMERIRFAFKALTNIIQGSTPESRERSLAITHLETAAMWANKAIVFNQEEQDHELQ